MRSVSLSQRCSYLFRRSMFNRIKQNGEVFTPLELVDEILDKLSPEVWQPKKTFLDPSAGNGNFLVRVLERKLKQGHKTKQALKTIYGVELMKDNTEECKQRLLEIVASHESITDQEARKKYGKIVDKNIVCSDALFKWDFENWKSLSDMDITKDVFGF